MGGMSRPRRIERSDVLDAALAIADEEGLDSVTMSAVGHRLDVSAMALYRHVANKANLLDGLVERLLDDVPFPDRSRAPREQLTALGDGVRDAARRHPAVFPLLLARPARTDRARQRRDLIVDLIRQLGVPAARASRLERLISTMVLGFVVSEAAGRFEMHSKRVRDADWEALGQIVDASIELHRR
jgi:AcrR family transcriptional regulator